MKRLLLALIFLGALLQAETIFHKKDGTDITPEEHKVLYTILLKYQFPACTQFGVYVKDEIKAMNNAIKRALPKSDIEATFMPTTLYEVFVIAAKEDYNEEILEAFPGNFQIVLENKKLIDFHRKINNFIIATLKKNSLPIPKKVHDSLKILDIIVDKNIDIPKKTLPYHDYPESELLKNKTILKRAIEIDHLAFPANKYPLYRAASTVESTPFQTNQSTSFQNQSLSFGSSLLGGFFMDLTACAYCIATVRKKTLLYAVFIDKQSAVNGALKNIFFIPSLIALNDMYQKGELFHARSKAPVISYETQGFDHEQCVWYRNFQRYYEIKATSTRHAQLIYEYIFTFIKNHHVIVTGEKPIKLPQPPNKPLPPFPQSQPAPQPGRKEPSGM